MNTTIAASKPAENLSIVIVGAMAAALYPMMKGAMERMQKEGTKLKGTALASSTKFESVKSKEQMAQPQQQESGGGGLSGMLARKMLMKEPPAARGTLFTANHEVLSIAASAADGGVAIPAGFKDKTKR